MTGIITTSRYPGYLCLPPRERQLLHIYGCGFPDKQQVVMNLSQSDVSIGDGNFPCVTPQGRFWLAWRARLAEGVETMRCQGLFVDVGVCDKFSSSLLHNLAGNAFSATCCQKAIMVKWCVASRLWQMRCERRRIPAAISEAPKKAPQAKKRCRKFAADSEAQQAKKRRRSEQTLCDVLSLLE